MYSGRLKSLFIINPILKKKFQTNISNLIVNHLNPDRFIPTILDSEYPGHAKELARENVEKYHLIVAVGGDGTINQVAYSLAHSQTLLGILPLGSGKGLARSLKIPMNIRNAIRIINRLDFARIDTGMVDIHRFINIAGIGFAAEVAHAYAGSQKRGFFSYAVKIVSKLRGYSPISAQISIGNRNITGSFFIISFANFSQWGYGAHISPNSKPDDGLFEICIIRDFPKILIPVFLIRLYTKTIYRSRYVEIIPAKKAGISGIQSFKGHIDGEAVEFPASFNIAIEPGNLKVICPVKH